MSLSEVLLPDRRPGREPTQGSRPDPHHQPTEAPPFKPNLHRRWLPTRAPPQPLCVPQTLPCATVRTRWSSGPIGPCWAGYASLWRVSAAGSSMHARDVGVVARCVVARCVIAHCGVGAAFRRAGSVGVPVVALRCPCCCASFVLAAGPLRLLAAAAACRCPACVPWPRAKADVTDPAPAAGMVSALCLTLSRPQNVVQLKHCQCCCDNSWTIVLYRLTIQ